MADKKISQLTALSAANLAPSTDVLAIVDTSATETKKIVAQDLINGVLNVASAVGIGTASPGAKLAIAQSSNAITQGLLLINAAGTQNGGWYHGGSALIGRENGVDTIALASGNVGIGTASPSDKLHVVGLARINTGTYAAGYGLTFQANAETARTYQMGMVTGGNFAIYDSTAATQRVVLDTSGNLGIGGTPNVWLSSFRAIQLGQGSSLWGSATGNNAGFDSNAYVNTSGGSIYVGSTSATRYQQNDGKHLWYTSTDPTPTAGNPISFTQAMTLDASGNLGVGITSPNSRLDVVGGTGIRVNEDGAGTKVIQVRSNFAGVAPAINVSTNDPLLFQTNNTERGRFTAGGYFKASNAGTYQGSTLAYHELRTDAADYSTIVGNTNASPYGAYILFGSADPNNSTNLFLLCNGWNGSSLATRATIRSNGGLANYQSNNVDLSDARTKKDIAPAASMWDKIGALEIVTYKYNDQTHDDVNVGVIAQQVESVEPVWVDADGFGETPEGEEPLKTVYTKDITFAAVKALQEAMARIEQLEADMAALKASA